MQHNSVIQPARGRWLAGAAVIAGTMLVSACGSSNPAPSTSISGSATPTSSAVAAGPTPGSVTVATPTVTATPVAPATPVATPTTSVSPGGPDASTQSCAYKRAHDRFMQISSARQASNGALDVTGYAEVLVCGGPDDFHWNTTSPERGVTVPSVSIITFPTTTMKPAPIKASQFAAYLKTDTDTKIFLVSGSIDAVTSLQEQFHP